MRMIALLVNWNEIMFEGMDVTEVGKAQETNASWWYAIYFIVAVIISHYFW